MATVVAQTSNDSIQRARRTDDGPALQDSLAGQRNMLQGILQLQRRRQRCTWRYFFVARPTVGFV